MSLQVWLPLTKDLRQQGLSNVAVVNNGATYSSTGGKLGGCYSFDGTDDKLSYTPSVDGLEEFSITLWLCPTSNTSAPSGAFFSIERDTYWQITFWSDKVGIRDNSIGWNGTRKDFSTGTYTPNVWTHIAITYNKGTLKIYRDGILLSTNSVGGTKLNTGINNARIGSAVQDGYYHGGKINDVRFYDNCLSAEEVKRVSRGLVLHYNLSDSNLESTINIFSTSNNGSGIAVDCTSTTMAGYHPNQNVTLSLDTMLNGLPCIRCNTEQTSSTPGIELCYNWQVEQNTDYTFSGWIESNCAAGLSAYQIKNTTYKAHPSPEFVSVTFNSGTNTVIRFFLFIIASSTVSGQYAKISQPQLEAKDHVTGFTPGERLEPIVYDSSGYCNNGTINGDLIISTDTPKYKLSTYLDNDTSDTTHPAQKIYITNEDIRLKSMSQFTIAGWFKQEAFNRGGKITTTAPLSSGDYYATSGVDDYDGQIHFRTTDNSVVTISGFYNTTNKWDHIVFTFDGINAKEYLNGELKETKSFSSAKTIDINCATIGANYAGGVSRCYKGYVNDYRIYTTALSADDVLALYNKKI